MLALGLPGVARAAGDGPCAPVGSQGLAGCSTDIELLRPTFSYQSIPGLDSAAIGEEGTIRVGLVAQYERSPLTLWEFDNELGAIVSNRATMQLGVSWDFFERAGARLTLPVAANMGTNIPSLSASTLGLGDADLGLHFLGVKAGGFKLGARADLLIPTGVPKQAWIGEGDLRPVVGLLASQDVGPLRAMLDANATVRTTVDTTQDFALGSELAITPGLLVKVRPDLLNVYGEGMIRAGFNNFFKGGAENPIETVIGAQFYPKDNILVDVGGGKGWNQGYGTTDFRIFAGLTYTFVKKEEPPVIAPSQRSSSLRFPRKTSRNWSRRSRSGNRARSPASATTRSNPQPDPALVDTANVKPESLPTLRYVADLMNKKGEIAEADRGARFGGRQLRVQLRPVQPPRARHLGRANQGRREPRAHELPVDGRGGVGEGRRGRRRRVFGQGSARRIKIIKQLGPLEEPEKSQATSCFPGTASTPRSTRPRSEGRRRLRSRSPRSSRCPMSTNSTTWTPKSGYGWSRRRTGAGGQGHHGNGCSHAGTRG